MLLVIRHPGTVAIQIYAKVERSNIELVHTCMYGIQFVFLVDRRVSSGLGQHGASREAVYGTDTEN